MTAHKRSIERLDSSNRGLALRRAMEQRIAEEEAARQARLSQQTVPQTRTSQEMTTTGPVQVKETAAVERGWVPRGIRTVEVLATDEQHAARGSTQTPVDEAMEQYRSERWNDKITE